MGDKKGYPKPLLPKRTDLMYMEDFEDERGHFINWLKSEHGKKLNLTNYPNNWSNISFESSNIAKTTLPSAKKISPKGTGLGDRTKAENSTLSKGIAYQCNIINKGISLVGYEYKSKGSASDVQLYDWYSSSSQKKAEKNIEAYVQEWGGCEPYRWNDSWDKRNDWRREYSWCTGLPLCFDSDILYLDELKRYKGTKSGNPGTVVFKKFATMSVDAYTELSGVKQKPQCEHKDPLFQQVYFGAGPVTPIEMRYMNKNIKMKKEDWSKLFAKKFMKNITNMTIEAYKNMAKFAGGAGWKETSAKYIQKVNDIISERAQDVKVVFESDIGDDKSLAPSMTESIKNLAEQPITKKMRTWKNFIVNKYLIRGEKYAWEYRHVNMWGKNAAFFLDLNFETLKYEPSISTIESFINKISWCRDQRGFHRGGGDGIVHMWARIATNIMRAQASKTTSRTIETLIKQFRKNFYQMLPELPPPKSRDTDYTTYGYGLISNYTVIKQKPSDILTNIDNTRFYAIDVELWCIWENYNSFTKTGNYEHNNNHGIISFINSCLGGNQGEHTCHVSDMGLNNLCRNIGGSYTKKYLKANILNQSYFANLLFNYSLNEGPYEIKTLGLNDAESNNVRPDQGIRNMLHFNYLRCRRLVKKGGTRTNYSPKDFKDSDLFKNLKNINSLDHNMSGQAQKWLIDNVINPNNNIENKKGGGPPSSSSSSQKPSANSGFELWNGYDWGFIDKFFPHSVDTIDGGYGGYEGIHHKLLELSKEIDQIPKTVSEEEGRVMAKQLMKEKLKDIEIDEYYPTKDVIEGQVLKILELETTEGKKPAPHIINNDNWETLSQIGFNDQKAIENTNGLDLTPLDGVLDLSSLNTTTKLDSSEQTIYNSFFYKQWCDLFLKYTYDKLIGNTKPSSSSSSNNEYEKSIENGTLYPLNLNNDYYTDVKKKENMDYTGPYLTNNQKRELRRYLFTIDSNWIQGVKKVEEEYKKKYGKSIEEQIKELYNDPIYINKVEEDEEYNKRRKGEKKSNKASIYRKGKFKSMEAYWKNIAVLNLKKYTNKPYTKGLKSDGCKFKVFQEIYRVCAKENNCPPAYISNTRNSFPRLKEEELKNINVKDGFNIPFIGNKVTKDGNIFELDGRTKCLPDFEKYIQDLLNDDKKMDISSRINLLFLKHIVHYKGMIRPRKQKLREYEKKIDDIDIFLKNTQMLSSSNIEDKSMVAKSVNYYETVEKPSDYPDVLPILEKMYKDILKNDKEINNYVKKLKDENNKEKIDFSINMYYDEILKMVYGEKGENLSSNTSVTSLPGSPPQNQINNKLKNTPPGHHKREFQGLVKKQIRKNKRDFQQAKANELRKNAKRINSNEMKEQALKNARAKEGGPRKKIKMGEVVEQAQAQAQAQQQQQVPPAPHVQVRPPDASTIQGYQPSTSNDKRKREKKKKKKRSRTNMASPGNKTEKKDPDSTEFKRRKGGGTKKKRKKKKKKKTRGGRKKNKRKTRKRRKKKKRRKTRK